MSKVGSKSVGTWEYVDVEKVRALEAESEHREKKSRSQTGGKTCVEVLAYKPRKL